MPEVPSPDRPLRATSLLLIVVVIVAFFIGPARLLWHGISFATSAEGFQSNLVRPAVQGWWGSRDLPHRGRDLLGVLERRGTLEASNEMVGAVLSHHLRQGGHGTELVIPTDLELMSGQVLTLTLDSADGSRIVREVPVFAEERLRRITPLPVSTAGYDPALREEDLQALGEPVVRAEFPHGWASLFGPSPNSSGVFVLHTTPGRDGILVVPLELSPVEGSR
jgi:hypothetical protein